LNSQLHIYSGEFAFEATTVMLKFSHVFTFLLVIDNPLYIFNFLYLPMYLHAIAYVFPPAPTANFFNFVCKTVESYFEDLRCLAEVV